MAALRRAPAFATKPKENSLLESIGQKKKGYFTECEVPLLLFVGCDRLFVCQTALHVDAGLLAISQDLCPDFLQAVDGQLILLRSQITMVILVGPDKIPYQSLAQIPRGDLNHEILILIHLDQRLMVTALPL